VRRPASSCQQNALVCDTAALSSADAASFADNVFSSVSEGELLAHAASTNSEIEAAQLTPSRNASEVQLL